MGRSKQKMTAKQLNVLVTAITEITNTCVYDAIRYAAENLPGWEKYEYARKQRGFGCDIEVIKMVVVFERKRTRILINLSSYLPGYEVIKVSSQKAFIDYLDSVDKKVLEFGRSKALARKEELI
jgi:hypothetical protein